MITSTSRYYGRTITLLPSNEGDARLTILPPEPDDVTFNFTYYRWVDGDRIDVVAYNFYGDATLWWVIADANPEVMEWSSIARGTVIRVPGA